MAEKGNASDGGPTVYGFPADKLYDTADLPDFHTNFLPPEDLEAFVQALAAPDPLQSPVATPGGPLGEDAQGATPAILSTRNSIVGLDGEAGPGAGSFTPQIPQPFSQTSLFISAKNDWAPTYEKVTPLDGDTSTGALPSINTKPVKAPRLFSSSWLPSLLGWKRTKTNAPTAAANAKITKRQQQRRRAAASAASAAAGKRARAKSGPGRTQDETREGYLYGLLKWPFLFGVFSWIIGLSVLYLLTRAYVAAYEQLITWRGRREKLRHHMRATSNYADWVAAANDMDEYLGNDKWKEENEFAFYDFRTVRRVADQLRRCRVRAESGEQDGNENSAADKAVADLKALVEACVKNNFAGIENRHLYSRTYYGTKNLVQTFIDEVERSLQFLIQSNQLDAADKRTLYKRLYANYGRTALCLSGGASFAYYHFGVVRALLDQDLLPDVITGTSGGALVAALVATRTNEELSKLLVPALAGNITACSEPFRVWFARWWKTGARFDSVTWARQCSWWTRGSMTFREAYERTGRILNITCIPADPHSPAILCNYRTSPDCVIWSAVLASAAVPGVLNPVVLMMKTPSGRLVPYSFGHKWKDGSLRTDIPIKSLNLHFNVNFTIVSQVNPHVNLFFFSSRGSVGLPVTHRKGRGWRGGYLGSAFEEYLKQDLRKWLKLLRNLELLPRPLGQDWSQLWLQPFSGTITIWPKSILSDFIRILSDPTPPELARMLHEGQQSAYPPLKFISNRLRIERLVQRGRTESRAAVAAAGRPASNSLSSAVSRDHDESLRPLRLGPGHAVSSSIDSLLSDEEDVRHRGQHREGGGRSDARRIRRLARLDNNESGLGLSGLGSTTATSDENISDESDMYISSGGVTDRQRLILDDDDDDDEDEVGPIPS
ncbi:patatin-like phospholipase domain-containing protein [Ophiostoma piceae UAMH 11346]|uniref:Patatin-like phospholipase domain-containing protein n=1 Tax=Ophiostoma piceae (strain UAMH 11346) TaxID=1262450 RepID=S3CLB9_OPHP1|nr:patatin-like phospholipase domain-containing protein [Ophiostoma piceae UAMH 11346]